MRSSLFLPTRQASNRICVFCRQQRHLQLQQLQSTTTMTRATRILHTSQSTQQQHTGPQSSPLRSSPPRRITSEIPRSFTTRSSSSSSSSSAPPIPGEAEGSRGRTDPKAEKAKPRTYYDFFPQTLPSGPPPHGHFTIDVRALRLEFLRLQAAAHPDRHSGANVNTQGRESAQINEAYRALSDPLSRAQHILALRGVDVAGDEAGRVEDPELLAAVMEAREEVEDAAADGSEEELAEVRRVNEVRIKKSVEMLDELFGKDDLVEARKETVRLRFWVNVRETIDNWEEGGSFNLKH